MITTPGKDNTILVIADADALIGLVNEQDALHSEAMRIASWLTEAKAEILYPLTAVLEAATNLQRGLSRPYLAQSLLNLAYEDEKFLVDIDREIVKQAISYFNPQGSKQNTIFDCVIAAVARKYDTPFIFSFDGWYEKLGFRLARDLI